jgi:very-short-patch-repair endonuclease
VRLFDPLINLTESELEAMFFEMCVTYDLPRPAPQVRFERRRADFTFEAARLVIECDSRKWHDNDFSFVDDRRKERLLKARGYELLRYTWAEIRYEPARVAAEIKDFLRQRGSSGA